MGKFDYQVLKILAFDKFSYSPVVELFALWSLYYRFQIEGVFYIVIFMSLLLNKLSFTFSYYYYIHASNYIKGLYRFTAQIEFKLVTFDSHLYENLRFFFSNFLFIAIAIRIFR